MCAKQRFDTLQESPVLRWATDSLFKAAPDEVRWVDGSGLSRYNLLSPNFLSGVLLELWKTQKDQKRLLSLFPAGGQSGTLANWFAPPAGKPPYVFAKTGSMGGVYCLSGYLRADSGKWYVFSFMYNNFTGSNIPCKEEIQRLLGKIREKG
jgi:D-alanyl-D-alanine carboxypeptidase/D-alanyl-D-alanine-endopeptidase (penicillin-binding protein 4)